MLVSAMACRKRGIRKGVHRELGSKKSPWERLQMEGGVMKRQMA